MKTNLLKLLRHLHRGDKLKFNRKLITLIVCIAVSTVFWLLNAYSKVYNSVIQYPVSYVNLPENRVLVNRLPSHISLMLRAQGFTLMYQKMRGKKDTVFVNISGLNLRRHGELYTGLFNTRDKIDEITSQFDPEISLLKIIPDTIRFTFAARRKKVVPVKLRTRVDFEKQYQIEGKIVHEPATVTVSGPDFILDTLSYIFSDSLILNGLSETTVTSAKLLLPEGLQGVHLETNEVKVTIPVERYTEASLSVVVDPVNVPEGYEVKLIPSRIEVTFLIPFSKYDDVSSRSFSAKVDFKKFDRQKRLPVEIISQPGFVTNVRTDPTKVEFILRKK